MTRKLVGSDEERAVSPVIGVILMVAITVILAAVIAAFVLDMGPSEPDPQAAVDIEANGTSEVTVTLDSMTDGDGIAVVPQDNWNDLDSSYQIESTSVSGNSIDVTYSDDLDSGLDDGDYRDFTVIAYTGEDPQGWDDSESFIDTSNDPVNDLEDRDGINIVVADEFSVEGET
ncbi:type IV pilin [Halopiger goleimassiliensis]|uniref:type IV pilin n=1 Tax=Halopiger goleimassiliensis TaxID=1293048 RepID=UPI00373FCCA8